jgi:ribosomal protein S18 acetylase RimI-like enzyme
MFAESARLRVADSRGRAVRARGTTAHFVAFSAPFMPPGAFHVRSMTRDDLPAVGKLAAALVRFHHATDPQRFLLVDHVEVGYARYFGRELNDEAVVLLSAIDTATDAVVGYAYGRLEARDWNMLLDAHGALHDVLVTDEARGHGVGESLVREVCRRLDAKGAPRIVLNTMESNTQAQALFAKLGFRKTMLEMTRERGAPDRIP